MDNKLPISEHPKKEAKKKRPRIIKEMDGIIYEKVLKYLKK